MRECRLISYNVNGIRAAIRKGFLEWMKESDFDLICVQESKANSSQLDLKDFENIGYKSYWKSAQKKGYSGVIVFSKREPDNVIYESGMEKYDYEGRIIRLDFGDVTLLNCYYPSGSSGEVRQAFKMQFLDDFFIWINELKKERTKLIVCGDFNICHKPIDIHDPVRNKDTSGFKPEERAWMSKYFDSGFIDTFRHFNSEPHHYSWWSYRANARSNNKGWRIDYISTTESMKVQLLDAAIFPEVHHSDHCPIYLKFKI